MHVSGKASKVDLRGGLAYITEKAADRNVAVWGLAHIYIYINCLSERNFDSVSVFSNGAEPHQVQQGSREGSGGGFGAEPGRDQEGFGNASQSYRSRMNSNDTEGYY